MKGKQKRKKTTIFCKKQRAERTRLSAEQEVALLPSLRAESWCAPQAAAISLCCHLPVLLWDLAVAAPATDLRRQLCASRSLPAIVPCLS